MIRKLSVLLACAASISLAAPGQSWTQLRDQKHYPTGVADTDSILWISTYTGLLEVDQKTGGTRLIHPRANGAAYDSVWSIADGGNGTIWMGLHNGSVARYDGKTWINMPLPASPGFTMEIVKVAMDRQGMLWVHAYQSAGYFNESPGIFRYDGEAWTTYARESLPPNPANAGLSSSGVSRSPWAMSLDTSGHVWIISSAGLYDFADGRWNWRNSIPGGAFYSYMIAAPDGRKWVNWKGKQGSGVDVCRPDSGCALAPGDMGFRAGLIGTGADGDVWVGTGSGIHRVRDSVIETVNVPRGLAFPPHARRKGTWFVDYHDASLVGDSGIIATYPFTNLRGGVLSIAFGPRGSRYFATTAGPMRLQDGAWTRFPDSPPFRYASDFLFEPKSRTMAVGPDGTVWMGDFHGLWKLNDTGWTAQYHDDVGIIVIGKDGAVFSASDQGTGIIRLDGSGLTRYDSSSTPLLWNATLDMLADKAGRIWVANDSGAHYLDQDGWHTVADLRGTRIYGLAQDSSGHIWASGGIGVWYLEDGRAIPRFPVEEDSTWRNNLKIAVDAANRVWVIQYNGGVLYLEDGRWNSITASPTGLLTNMNDCIAIAPDGDIWIGGPEGVSILDFQSLAIRPASRASGNLKPIFVPGGVRYTLERSGPVRLEVMDASGKTFLARRFSENAGTHFLPIPARPGIAILRLAAPEGSASLIRPPE